MDMQTWLGKATTKEVETLASKVGTKPIYLRQIGSGFRRPSPALAKAIEIESGDAIRRHELRPDIFDAPESRKAA